VEDVMRAVRRMAYLSITTSLTTIVLKFSAYFLTGSVSLWSDALESLVNLAAGLVALGALMVAEQPADDRHAYGHDKAEYFSSGVEGALSRSRDSGPASSSRSWPARRTSSLRASC
jgi:divalent metal cation (Fe/Co/Zn/Cd) transporter